MSPPKYYGGGEIKTVESGMKGDVKKLLGCLKFKSVHGMVMIILIPMFGCDQTWEYG